MDSIEVSFLFLVNVKLVYRNGLYFSEDSFFYEGLKRKFVDLEYFVVKWGWFIFFGLEIYLLGSFSDVLLRSSSFVGEKFFECFLCEEKFLSEEDRICYIILVYKSKSNIGWWNFIWFVCYIC